MRKTLFASIALLAMVAAAAAVTLQEDPKGSPPAGKGLAQAQTVLSEKEHATMGLFVVEELEQGIRGKALAEAIHQEHALLKQEHEAREKKKDEDSSKPDADSGAGKKGPGEALKHGLSDKDFTNFGKFVNEQLAAGLRGEDLADAIQKRHEELKAARTSEHTESHPSTPAHPRHRPPGHH